MEHTMDAEKAAVAVAVGWKGVGTAAAVYGLGAALATVVVMLMTPPRSAKEWAVGLISTVTLSITGGAALIEQLGLQRWMDSTNGLIAILGLVFTCGLPAWAVVRWVFTWLERRKDRDIAEIADEVRRQLGGGQP